jgi:hypothetical protein
MACIIKRFSHPRSKQKIRANELEAKKSYTISQTKRHRNAAIARANAPQQVYYSFLVKKYIETPTTM